MIQVSRLSVTPVKGFAVWHPDEVVLGESGVAEDRRFYLVDEDGLRFGALRHGPLVRFSARYDAAAEELVLRLPDGSEVAGTVELAEPETTDFYGRDVSGHVVRGPWAEAVSANVARRVPGRNGRDCPWPGPASPGLGTVPGRVAQRHVGGQSLMKVRSAERPYGVADADPAGEDDLAVDAEVDLARSGILAPVVLDRAQRVEVADPRDRGLRRDRAAADVAVHPHARLAELHLTADPRVLLVRAPSADRDEHPEPPRVDGLEIGRAHV